jgi:hypothetical protein
MKESRKGVAMSLERRGTGLFALSHAFSLEIR